MNETPLLESALEGLADALRRWENPAINEESQVAVQLPAGLVRYHGEISSALRSRFGCDVMVLLRPTYGACDIPYRDLEAMKVSHLVHFGHAPIGNLVGPVPTIFVPVRLPVDFSVISETLQKALDEHSLRGKRVVLTATVQYADSLPELGRALESNGVEIRISPGTGRTGEPGQVLGCNFEASRGGEADMILFLGTGSFHPLGMSNCTGLPVLAFNPVSGDAVLHDGKDFLKRRAAIALSLPPNGRFIIVACTRVGQERYGLARELVRTGREKGYSCELALLDEIRPEYFLGVNADAIVSTACPRIAYDDWREYPVPVITPQEFLLAAGVLDIEELSMDELK